MSYIVITDTVFQGRVASWRDEDGRPCLFDDEQAALAECEDGDDVEPVDVMDDGSIVGRIDGRVYWNPGASK